MKYVMAITRILVFLGATALSPTLHVRLIFQLFIREDNTILNLKSYEILPDVN